MKNIWWQNFLAATSSTTNPQQPHHFQEKNKSKFKYCENFHVIKVLVYSNSVDL